LETVVGAGIGLEIATRSALCGLPLDMDWRARMAVYLFGPLFAVAALSAGFSVLRFTGPLKLPLVAGLVVVTAVFGVMYWKWRPLPEGRVRTKARSEG
jgi:hypothetical protein